MRSACPCQADAAILRRQRSWGVWFFATIIGWMMKGRSGAITGATIATLSAAFLMAPAWSDYGITTGTIVSYGWERRDEAAKEAAETGDLSGYADDFQDRAHMGWNAFFASFGWFFGLGLGVVLGTLFGELAKAGPLRRVIGAGGEGEPAPPLDRRAEAEAST